MFDTAIHVRVFEMKPLWWPTFICSVNAVVHIKTNFMSYSVTDLTTLGACDAYLSEKNQEITRVENSIANTQFTLENGNNSQGLAQEMAVLENNIAQIETLIAGMPEGRDRRRQERILRDMLDDLSRLEDREETIGLAARIDRELRLNNLQDTLVNLQEVVAEVTAHRASLVASGIAA